MEKKAYYVDCPHCGIPTIVHYNEWIPARNNQCMAICDSCRGGFSLLNSDYCKTCVEFNACMKFPGIDLLSLLSQEKLMRISKAGTRVLP